MNTMERIPISIRPGYDKVIEEIQKEMPQLNSKAVVVERALDHYNDHLKHTEFYGGTIIHKQRGEHK